MFLSTFSLLLLTCLQEPTQALQRALDSDDVLTRFAAAHEVANGDERAEAWLLAKAGKGTAQRQRAILLAAGLMGTPQTYAVLEKAARKGRKADPQRAFALLLYGSFHPTAGVDADKDWSRGSTPFEKGCLLAGLLTRPERLTVAPWPSLLVADKESSLTSFLDAALALTGNPMVGSSQISAGLRFLIAADPSKASVPTDLVMNQTNFDFPAMWFMTARRAPPRPRKAIQSMALVGEQIGMVLSLYEVPANQRQGLFFHFQTRAVGALERKWLWGAAGDLGLELPPPNSAKLATYQVCGILSLANRDWKQAKTAAQNYLMAARSTFQTAVSFQDRWAAATVLALGGMEADRNLIKKSFENASAVERHRLVPIWKFANHGLESPGLRQHWLKIWVRDLGGGWRGYLDAEGARWTAYVLVGNSLAAKNRVSLSTSYPGLEGLPKDYALDHVLYRDLAEFLLSSDYGWDK
ncbi:MAG: hypothetical protein QM477_07925 [Planctomycetota bacterium]